MNARELFYENGATSFVWLCGRCGRPHNILYGAKHCCCGERLKLVRPTIVCLCGSTRFGAAFREANLAETLRGKIVLSIGCDMRSDAELFAHNTDSEREQVKERLDKLHLRKIDLADEVLILNAGGYIGESTQRELDYARRLGKTVHFLEQDPDQRVKE